MVFSSNIFLFAFLPCVLIGWFATKRWRRVNNIFLTFASLIFYAWGEPTFVMVMMGSIVLNWLFGLWLEKRMNAGKSKKPVIWVMSIFNLSLLGVYKYLGFLLKNIAWAFNLNFPIPQIALPIGISFFTFQAMSYVIDCSRGQGKVQKNLLDVALYISFFPQLIAGPIVRYQTVAEEIHNRHETLDDFLEGIRRFMVGLCKKVLLANNLALLTDTVFALPKENMSFVISWIGAMSYVAQTYYDFSGYSDMAIGLGRIFGFHFLENFRLPFLSKSVGGFWKRWHLSMGSWFQDYVYFPMGGSRVKSKLRLCFNIMVTWTLTGLWHGAQWTYFFWGFTFGVFLLFERFTGIGKWMEKHPIGHLYAMFIVVTVSVMIQSPSMSVAGNLYTSMFCIDVPSFLNGVSIRLIREYGLFLLASILCGIPTADYLKRKLHISDKVMEVLGGAALLLLTFVSVTYIATGSYNPFIYYNF